LGCEISVDLARKTFADGTPRPMSWVIALAGIGSLLCARCSVSTGG
jgi:hypothetical protein